MSFSERFKDMISRLDRNVADRNARLIEEENVRRALSAQTPSEEQQALEDFRFIEPLGIQFKEILDNVNANLLNGQGNVTVSSLEFYPSRMTTSGGGQGDRQGISYTNYYPAGFRQNITLEVKGVANFTIQGKLDASSASHPSDSRPRTSYPTYIIAMGYTPKGYGAEWLSLGPHTKKGHDSSRQEVDIANIPVIFEYFASRSAYLELVRGKDDGYFWEEFRRITSEEKRAEGLISYAILNARSH